MEWWTLDIRTEEEEWTDLTMWCCLLKSKTTRMVVTVVGTACTISATSGGHKKS